MVMFMIRCHCMKWQVSLSNLGYDRVRLWPQRSQSATKNATQIFHNLYFFVTMKYENINVLCFVFFECFVGNILNVNNNHPLYSLNKAIPSIACFTSCTRKIFAPLSKAIVFKTVVPFNDSSAVMFNVL